MSELRLNSRGDRVFINDDKDIELGYNLILNLPRVNLSTKEGKTILRDMLADICNNIENYIADCNGKFSAIGYEFRKSYIKRINSISIE